MNRNQVITAMVSRMVVNKQLNLVLTKDGFSCKRKNSASRTPFFIVATHDDLATIAADKRPADVVDFLAEFIEDNFRKWIITARQNISDGSRADAERLAFYDVLLR